MNTLTLVITILQLLCGLAVIVVVLFQSGKSAGLSGSIGGVADSFLARNKAKTMDAKLGPCHQVGWHCFPDPDPDSADSAGQSCLSKFNISLKHPCGNSAWVFFYPMT